MVTEMDTAIGRIRTAIESENIAENTLVLFMSDNGGNPELGASNTPLRGAKGFVWEGGIRVPAAIYWPGKLQADLSGEFPDVFARLRAELDAMPKLQPVTLGQKRPDRGQLGSPRAIAADDRPADKPPYTETARTD